MRTVVRAQVLCFYVWSLSQPQAYRTMGLAAMLCYLTGFRAAEIRPFHKPGITDEGVRVVSAKRKRGQEEIVKLCQWSKRLWAVVERAKRDQKVASVFLFPNRRGHPYTKSGWASVWQDAMYSFIGEFDNSIAREYEAKKMHEAAHREPRRQPDPQRHGVEDHKAPAYFSMLDIRPTTITAKLTNRDSNADDFASHADRSSSTHGHYDRRRARVAKVTE
ncbi:hypothetical protein [Paraburkholderia kururiensis]|uniref:hypothetical protein n=1 Tax=Paraburkholderia kururiensis TaxID=984307 RepID=UPI0005AAA40B|nr:hypothetical protein [Paraburkholderia kururiensis]